MDRIEKLESLLKEVVKIKEEFTKIQDNSEETTFRKEKFDKELFDLVSVHAEFNSRGAISHSLIDAGIRVIFEGQKNITEQKEEIFINSIRMILNLIRIENSVSEGK
jgi:transcriptional regulator of heat shock response